LIRPERLDQLDIPHPNVAGISKCSFADIKKHERAGSIHFLSDTSLFNLYRSIDQSSVHRAVGFFRAVPAGLHSVLALTSMGIPFGFE
jgi:hypothetical protein